ncbi:hypothetical protein GCK72_012811 [Caenorhabditis remanei]|uniref:Uncharacterized protein n=1 Tax=Caenorhabditis remanei TaxID=31234 RepID=A0A6A5GLY7_CAERE|nr:hypothetical protein GCK72_012811 [Caenorhabditis remanei]KAF1756358.1 hypothetical protein GCK72_012811 [Caenorhabditis remanei]
MYVKDGDTWKFTNGQIAGVIFTVVAASFSFFLYRMYRRNQRARAGILAEQQRDDDRQADNDRVRQQNQPEDIQMQVMNQNEI